MSKRKKVILGIISFLPILLMAVYFIAFLNMFLHIFTQAGLHQRPEDFFPSSMIPLMLIMALALACSFGLLVYYLVQVINNPRLESTERVIWILILLLAGIVGFPVYWYMKIWKEPS